MGSHDQRGTTLVEILLSISVFSVVIFFFSSMFIYNLRSFNRASARATAGEQSRNIIRSAAQTIREMQPSGAGAYPIASAQANSMTFFANVDADSGIERVRYTISGGKLEQGIIEPSGDPPTYPINTETIRNVATNILDDGQPYFTYFDLNFTGSQAALSEPVDVNLVRVVRVRTVIGTGKADTSTEELSFYVHLRNLKDNY